MVSMGKGMVECLKAVVRSDSSAALAISQRVGLGTVCHIEVQYLWIQGRHSSKDLELRIVNGEQNPADSLTKGDPRELLNRHAGTAGIEFRGGTCVATDLPVVGTLAVWTVELEAKALFVSPCIVEGCLWQWCDGSGDHALHGKAHGNGPIWWWYGWCCGIGLTGGSW